MKNFEVARLFSEMATLLEVHDESRFRVRAYQDLLAWKHGRSAMHSWL